MTGSTKALLLAAVCGALASLPAAAQQTGAIVGRVTERASGNPVPDANVFIVGTQRGARTSATGEYRISGVVAGTYDVRVTRIGYSAVTRSVQTAGSGEATADFVMVPAAVQIDEIVVTATGATERKRENGNDVSVIKPGANLSLAATPTLVQALAGKAAGLTITQSSGTPGTSSRIRIRGANSVSLSNEPLLIVDGVRIDNNSNSFNNLVGGQTISRFDDLNPEEIESIEVLKGPAASALYGTAAANGVLQVTTRKGRAGRTQWRSYADYGRMKDPTDYPDNYFTFGHTGTSTLYNGNCTLDRRTQGVCTADSTFTFNPLKRYDILGTGNQVAYGVSATGGAEAAQYYISGDIQRGQGIVRPSQTHNVNLRANVNARLRQNLTAQVTTAYIDRYTRLPINDNNIYGVVPNGILGKAFDCANGANDAGSAGAVYCGADTLSHGFYSVQPDRYYFMKNYQQTKRFIGGANVTWQPLEWLSAVAVGGLDMNNTLNEQIVPSNVVTYINSTIGNGYINEYRYQVPTYSASGTLTGIKTFGDIQSTTSVGSAYSNEQSHYTYGFGRNLIPGTYSLSGVGAGAQVNEQNQTVVTIGNYARQQFAWRDRLFVTGAIRADRNSAFGTRVTWAYYPSFSASYVLTEEPFLRDRVPSFLSELRLRAAYGQSGQRPAFRQAETYLNSQSVLVGTTEYPGVVIGGTGNTNLRPEISIENEFGFDASFLQNRIGVTYTYYRKITRDALIAAVLAPSVGVSSSYYRNLGRVRNAGNELTLNVTALDVRDTKLDIAVTGSTNHNRLESLGLDASGKPTPAIFFNPQRFQEGYPLGSYFQRKYTFSDANQNGIIERNEITLGDTASAAEYIGPVLPTKELSITPTLTYRVLRLSALFNYRGGNYLYNNTGEFRCGSSAFSMCDAVNDPKSSQALQAAAIAKNIYQTSYGFIEKADFWKLREVSATVGLPAVWAGRIGASSLSMTLAGRNLKTWSDYRGFDPEVQGAANNSNFTTFDFLTQPPLRAWSFRVDLGF